MNYISFGKIFLFADRIPEEVEQRFCSVDAALNRVVLVLDSVQSDLQQINKAFKDVSIESK